MTWVAIGLTGQRWILPWPGSHRDVHQDPRLTKGDIANGDCQQELFAGEVLDVENVTTQDNGKQITERCAYICLKSQSVVDAL